VERTLLAAWVRRELLKHNASELHKKLLFPKHCNYGDHEKLFRDND